MLRFRQFDVPNVRPKGVYPKKSTSTMPFPKKPSGKALSNPMISQTPLKFMNLKSSSSKRNSKFAEEYSHLSVSPYPLDPAEEDFVQHQTPALITRTKREDQYRPSISRKLSFSLEETELKEEEEEEEEDEIDDDVATVDLGCEESVEYESSECLWKEKVSNLQRAIAEMKEGEFISRRNIEEVCEEKIQSLEASYEEKLEGLKVILESKNKLIDQQMKQLKEWNTGDSKVVKMYDEQLERGKEQREKLKDKVKQKNMRIEILNKVIQNLKKKLHLEQEKKHKTMKDLEKMKKCVALNRQRMHSIEKMALSSSSSISDELENCETFARHWKESFDLSEQKNMLLEQKISDLETALTHKEHRALKWKKKSLENSRYIDAKNKVTEFLTREIHEIRRQVEESKKLIVSKDEQLGKAKGMYEDLFVKYRTVLSEQKDCMFDD